MKVSEIVYLILDELKLSSDDAKFTEDHIIFLIDKYRTFLLKQKYSDIRKHISESNYQTVCLDLIEVPSICGTDCEYGTYLRSKEKIPFLIQIGNPRVYPINYYQGEIAYVNRDRMKYVGYNKYLQNIIYCSIGPDNYLYLKSNNPQFLNLEKIKLMGIFIDNEKASELECDNNGDSIICDILDREFPLDNSLVELLVNYAVTELSGQRYVPTDKTNNASDDMSGMMSPNTRYKQPTVNYE